MKNINLKDLYPDYFEDIFIELSDDILDVFNDFLKAENAYNRKKYRYNAYYSLDRNDGIERDLLNPPFLTDKMCENNILNEQIYNALKTLPPEQFRRIYLHYFLNMNKTEIAKIEGVTEGAVRLSIKIGLKKIEKIIEKYL